MSLVPFISKSEDSSDSGRRVAVIAPCAENASHAKLVFRMSISLIPSEITQQV